MSIEKAQAVMVALSEAKKSVVSVQTALTEANQLAVLIPMYIRLGQIVTELRNMMVEAPKVPL